MSRTFTTPGIILKRRNFSEADRILTLLTPDYGKITTIAKGVRKPKSRKRGHIELFAHISAHIAKGRQLNILTEAQSINQFSQLRSRLSKVAHAYHLIEVVDRLLPDQDPQPQIFHWLIKAMNHLESSDSDMEILHQSFKLRLLQALGYWPSDTHPPQDIDTYLNSIFESPLYSPIFIQKLSANSK